MSLPVLTTYIDLSCVFITTDGNCLQCTQLLQHHHRAALSEIETLRNTGTKIVKEVNVLFTRVEIKNQGKQIKLPSKPIFYSEKCVS